MVNPSSAYDIDIDLSKDYNNKFLYREAYNLSLLINNSFNSDIYSKIIKKEEIKKGFSSDKKYTILDNDNNQYLLRISSIDKFKGKLNQFINMKKLVELNVNMIEPLEFGICDKGVNTIYSWIEGVDATDYIPKLSKIDQYKYGIITELELKKIHQLNAPINAINWEDRFNSKIDKKLNIYDECPLKYEKDNLMIEYINSNRHLLKGRPNTYQHRDYHIGNMMIDKNDHLVVIDFDRDDYGDLWEEFNRLIWSMQVSHEFASGIVEGYFSNNVTDKFWKLLALYVCVNSLSSLPWAIPYEDKEVNIMTEHNKSILKW